MSAGGGSGQPGGGLATVYGSRFEGTLREVDAAVEVVDVHRQAHGRAFGKCSCIRHPS